MAPKRALDGDDSNVDGRVSGCIGSQWLLWVLWEKLVLGVNCLFDGVNELTLL